MSKRTIFKKAVSVVAVLGVSTIVSALIESVLPKADRSLYQKVTIGLSTFAIAYLLETKIQECVNVDIDSMFTIYEEVQAQVEARQEPVTE